MSRALVDLVLLTPEGRKAAGRPDRRAGRHLEHRPERPKAPSKGRGHAAQVSWLRGPATAFTCSCSPVRLSAYLAK
jgi:hypothetical protein